MPIHLYPIFILKIISLCIGVYYWGRLTMPYRLLFSYVIISMLTDSIGLYLNEIKSPNNYWLFNMYNLSDVWLMSLIGLGFIKDATYRAIVLAFLVLLTGYWCYDFLLNRNKEFFNWFVVTYAVFLIVIYVAILLKSVLFKNKMILTDPLFVLCVSTIFFYGCIIPLFGVLNFLIKTDVNTAKKLFNINVVVNILRYILIAIAFYLYGSQAKRGYVQQ